MVKTVRRTIIGALLMMILPLIFWSSNWQWQLENNHFRIKWWYWLTQTVTLPWVIITSILLIIWFIRCLRYPLKVTLGLVIICITILFIGQEIKFFLKKQIKEIRPFVVWLNNYCMINNQTFNVIPHQTCDVTKIIKLKKPLVIPTWLQKHWQDELNFSFPSGHTIFASSWALLAIGLLWPCQHKTSTIILVIWASGVIVSRLVLGMHWPQDVIVGIIISWLIIIIGCWLAQYWIAMFKLSTDKH